MKTLKYWSPPIFYMALIFAVSSLQQPPLPTPKFEWLSIDKVYHFIEYFILSVLLVIALVNVSPKWLPRQWIWFAAGLISILYGASDELHQMYVPGRFATLSDWLSDVVGAIAGVVGANIYFNRRKVNVTQKKGINMHSLVDLNVPDGSIAIHWFEQSSFALKDSDGTVVLIDPYFPRNRPSDRFIHTDPPLDEQELPTDFVLLTHAHGDHTCPESIRRIWETSTTTRFIGPEESVRQIGSETDVVSENISEIVAGESININNLKVHAVFAKPPDGDPSADISPPDVTHLGYVIVSNGVTLYFSGDPINNFAEHDNLISAVAAFNPDIGFLTNHPTEGEFPFYDGCVKMATRIGLKHVVPVHRACFVTRDYDPEEWGSNFPSDGPEPLIIERNTHIIYP